MRSWFALLLTLSVLSPAGLAAGANPTRMEWTIEGTKREAAVFMPTKRTKERPPLVFGFHGHGGNMRVAAQTFDLQTQWPAAVVVYMEGLPTPSRIDPDGKRNGWQKNEGDQNDRDLKFFDAVLATMKTKAKIDEHRVYATGHSNGGGFTYLLWSARPDTFAAVAPSAGLARNAATLKPLPCLHIAGEKDQLVTMEMQQRTMQAVRKANGCSETGQPWAAGCKLYPSEQGAPFVAFIHPGPHKYPEDAPRLVVKFFQEHRRTGDATGK